MGFKHLLRQTDEKIASKEAGLDLRPCTTTEIQRHLDDFGLPQEFGTYGKIRGLSGGQKVKLVLAAAMWNCKMMMMMYTVFDSFLWRISAARNSLHSSSSLFTQLCRSTSVGVR